MSKHTQAKISRSEMSLGHVSDLRFRSFDFHAHDQYEIFFFLKGEIQYYLEDKAYLLVPGDLLIIPPSVLHRAVVVDENAAYQRYILMLSEGYCHRLLNGVDGLFTRKEMPPMHISLHGDQREDFQKRLEQMMLLNGDPAGFLACDCLCTLLLLQLQTLAQHYAHTEQPSRQQAQEIVRYINAHFTSDISLEDVAKHFFISKTHLMRQFKKYTHTTVHQYITTKRIMLAKALLKEKIPLAEVAEACGFASYAAFYQAFLHHTGTCPSQHQEQG